MRTFRWVMEALGSMFIAEQAWRIAMYANWGKDNAGGAYAVTLMVILMIVIFEEIEANS